MNVRESYSRALEQGTLETGGGEERAGGDIGDMDLKRTLEEIKRLQADILFLNHVRRIL